MLQNQITIPDELRSVVKYAFNGVSWSPEKRAESVLNEYRVVLSEMQAQIKALAGENADAEFERFSAKYTQLVINWLHAKSRCISSAVTGPSNFPVRRAEKANNAEQNRMEEMIDFRAKVLKALRSKYTDSGVIRSNDENAIDKLKSKLQAMQQQQEQMKNTNAAWRKYAKNGDDSDLKGLGFDDVQIKCLAAEVEKAYSWEKQPYPKYMLSNNNQNMRSVKMRIAELEKKAQQETTEKTVSGVRVVENTDEDRIQLFFPGKPESDVRSMLKSKGFRWSGKNGCWQCYLNQHGKWRTEQVLEVLEQLNN